MTGMTPEQIAAYGRLTESVKKRFGDNWQIAFDPEYDDEASVRTEDSTATFFTEVFATSQTGGDDPLEVAGFLAASIDYVPVLLAEAEGLRTLTATCTCGTAGIDYEGPQADCPVCGAVRALSEAQVEVERLTSGIQRLHHTRIGFAGLCVECDRLYPCPTSRLAPSVRDLTRLRDGGTTS